MPNLFNDLPPKLPAEITDILVECDSVRIERIVSTGQSSPDDFWYDQEESEWVVVLQGQAILIFADEDSTAKSNRVTLNPGDFIDIPAHCKHRVHWTTDEQRTIWLAIFYRK